MLSVNQVPDVYLMFVSLDVYTNLAKSQRFCRNLWKPMILWKSFTVMDKSSFEILKFQLFQQKITDLSLFPKKKWKKRYFLKIWGSFGGHFRDLFWIIFGTFSDPLQSPKSGNLFHLKNTNRLNDKKTCIRMLIWQKWPLGTVDRISIGGPLV